MMIILYLHVSLCGLSRSLERLILGLIHFLFRKMYKFYYINANVIELFRGQTNDLHNTWWRINASINFI